MLIEEKRDGQIKGRGVADGRVQRTVYSKEETYSPTSSQESVILTSIIDAKESREVAVCDIPNAFIQTDLIGETVIIRLVGRVVKYLLEIDRELYEDYVEYENGKPVLYTLALKAIYRMILSALDYYKNLQRK